MRGRPSAILIFTALLAVLLVPATASARLVVGISEANPPLFADPHFKALKLRTTRLLISYDAVLAARRGDRELPDRIVPYIDAAAAEGINPLVAFQRPWGAPGNCVTGHRAAQCRLPSLRRYRKAVRAFLVMFPNITAISPWNEANHFSQPTYRHPRRAAQYTNVVAQICRKLHRRCTVVAADVLDAADRPRAAHPTYIATERWIARFRRALRVPRGVCGLHNYSDVNRFRDDGTRALMRALHCRHYWVTETGGIYHFARFWNRRTRAWYGCPTAARCQARAITQMFRIARRLKRIERVYVQTWFTAKGQKFDAGLVRGGPGSRTHPRPAYWDLRRALRRLPR